ncbi:MAG TPA: glycosyltransferase family 4 protein [Lamprocystis sp. (in: g-proteobacteria)]|nr:glycosyltransferase family 4 protein [Lamprocystis sp. (in: g-proteobacteria)]
MVGLAGLGWRVEQRTLDASFPVRTPEALRQAEAVLASIPDGALVVVDGLAFGVLPELAQAQGERLRLVALVHHPLAAETGLAPERAAALRQSETRALAQARLVLVTSAFTARLLAAYGVPAGRIRVVEPGTDPAPVALGSPDPVPRLLSVGALVPRKGHDVLLRALAELSDLAWRLDCVGCTNRDPHWSSALLRLRDKLGLRERVSFPGVLTRQELDRRYAEADLFVLASRFEGYGMVFAEALAWGLPVLAARSGAVPETVPPGAGILVQPDDPAALAAALRGLLTDADRRRQLAAGARAVGLRLVTWPQAAAVFAAACEEVLHG